MATANANNVNNTGLEQIQAILSRLTTFQGREVTLPELDRLAVERDVVSVTSAGVAFISESMKQHLDKVQGLSILENLFSTLTDQGLIGGDEASAPSPNDVLEKALYELMLAGFEQQDGAADASLVNGRLGTYKGRTWYLTDSGTLNTAASRQASGDGVWTQHGNASNTVLDLAYLDATAIYDRVEAAIGWDKLAAAGVTPVTPGSTLDEVVASLEAVNTARSVASFAEHFAHAMVGSQLIDPNDLDSSGSLGILFTETYSPDSNNRVFDLDGSGNIEFVQVFNNRVNNSDGLHAASVVAPMWMTSYNPTGQESMGTYMLAQGQVVFNSLDMNFRLVKHLGGDGGSPVYQGSTSPVTMIESLWWAIESDPSFTSYLLDKYNLADPNGVAEAASTINQRNEPAGWFANDFLPPYYTEEHKIQPPKLRAMQAVVKAAFQEMSLLDLSTADLVQIAGGSATADSVTMDDTRPGTWKADLAAATTNLVADLSDGLFPTALDMLKDLDTLRPDLGGMTLAEIEAQMQNALDGEPPEFDYGSGIPGSALPYLEELEYRYVEGKDYDAALAHARNDMGALQDMKIPTFLSNSKFTRETLSTTTQTMMLDVKTAQANLENAIEMLDSTFEDLKNALRDLFANW